jgi:hypothetical protein
VETPPFYAWKVLPADLGTKGGIRCDGSARALRPDGSVLPGLYAAGNTMASWTNNCYPGHRSGPGWCSRCWPCGTCSARNQLRSPFRHLPLDFDGRHGSCCATPTPAPGSRIETTVPARGG